MLLAKNMPTFVKDALGIDLTSRSPGSKSAKPNNPLPNGPEENFQRGAFRLPLPPNVPNQKQSHADQGDVINSGIEHINVSLPRQRLFHSKDGQQFTYPIADRAKIEARICAGILGPGPLTFDMMVTPNWAKDIYSLPYRGVSRAGLAEYLARASVGAITDPLFPAGHQATKALTKMEQLPNLFLDIDALKSKKVALQEYAKSKISHPDDLKDPEFLAKIQTDLEADKMKYFGTESVEVVVYLKPAEKSCISDNVRQAFDRLEERLKYVKCEVTRVGTNLVPWEVTVQGPYGRKAFGTARTKREARMLALVKCYLAPNFDGSSPLPANVVASLPPPVPLPRGPAGCI